MRREEEFGRLSAELEAALVRELSEWWGNLNRQLFRGKLDPPVLALSDAKARLGLWIPSSRTLEISRVLVLERPWGVVVEVLKHEMAHQFVHEVLDLTSETAHGPAFRELCEKLGIDPTAAGMPEAAGAETPEARVLERIARLLALAESPNENEAQSAMSAAQKLMLRYNLDRVAQRHASAYGFRHLGKPSGRVSESERLVSAILSKHFFVEAIWVSVYRPAEGKQGSVLEVAGTQANLEMAAYVHAFLTHTAEGLWTAHKRAHQIRANRDRRSFLSGVMTGFYEKLEAGRKAQREEGLVWAGDGDLAAYHRRRHPHVHHVRHAGTRRTEAHAHGRAAGRQIVLHKPVQGGPAGSVRLLRR